MTATRDTTTAELVENLRQQAAIAEVLRLHPRFDWSIWTDFLAKYDRLRAIEQRAREKQDGQRVAVEYQTARYILGEA